MASAAKCAWLWIAILWATAPSWAQPVVVKLRDGNTNPSESPSEQPTVIRDDPPAGFSSPRPFSLNLGDGAPLSADGAAVGIPDAYAQAPEWLAGFVEPLCAGSVFSKSYLKEPLGAPEATAPDWYTVAFARDSIRGVGGVQVALVQAALERGRSREAYALASGRLTTPDAMGKLPGLADASRLTVLAARALSNLTRNKDAGEDWCRQQLARLDAALLTALAKQQPSDDGRVVALLAAARIRADCAGEVVEAIRLLDEAVGTLRQAKRHAMAAEVVRWVTLPMVFELSLRDREGPVADDAFHKAAARGIVDLSKAADAGSENGEELRVALLDALQLWVRYELSRGTGKLEDTSGHRILQTLSQHPRVAWRQQARVLLLELQSAKERPDRGTIVPQLRDRLYDLSAGLRRGLAQVNQSFSASCDVLRNCGYPHVADVRECLQAKLRDVEDDLGKHRADEARTRLIALQELAARLADASQLRAKAHAAVALKYRYDAVPGTAEHYAVLVRVIPAGDKELSRLALEWPHSIYSKVISGMKGIERDFLSLAAEEWRKLSGRGNARAYKDFELLYAGTPEARLASFEAAAEIGFESPSAYVDQQDWRIDDSNRRTGERSIRSPPIGDARTASFSLRTPPGARKLSFWYYVSADPGDTLKVYVDGKLFGTYANTKKEWKQVILDLSASGGQVIQWTYAKDRSYSLGRDAAWVDDMKLHREE